MLLFRYLFFIVIIYSVDRKCKSIQNSLSVISTITSIQFYFKESLSSSMIHLGYQFLQTLFAEIERLSNEKIRLASDTYELVDKHIRRLDNDSVKLQATIRQKYLDAAAAAAAKANKNGGKY